MRGLIATFVSWGLVGLTAMTVAATVRFQSKPSTTDNGTTLSVQGIVVGLNPSEPVIVRVRAVGNAEVSCVNPSAPGENQKGDSMPVTPSGEQSFQPSDITDGKVVFGVTTTEPSIGSAHQAGCPSDNWTAKITDVTFRSVTIRVFQGNRVVMRRTMNL